MYFSDPVNVSFMEKVTYLADWTLNLKNKSWNDPWKTFQIISFNPNPHGQFSNLIHMGRAYHKPSQYLFIDKDFAIVCVMSFLAQLVERMGHYRLISLVPGSNPAKLQFF